MDDRSNGLAAAIPITEEKRGANGGRKNSHRDRRTPQKRAASLSCARTLHPATGEKTLSA